MLPHRTIISALLAFVILFGTMLSASAQTFYEPPRGSDERKAILDAMRPKIETEMRGPVEFVVVRLRVMDGFAFAQLEPQRPGGNPINPANTVWANDIEMMDGLTVWGLAYEGSSGWGLVDAVTGPTDVAFFNWPEFYGAPPQIFGFQP
ncbi:MAG: hypothetical protein AAFY99_05340 [Pseudomonadota bacterium]